MRLVITPRQSGKTEQMLQWLEEDPTHRALVAFGEMEANRLRQEFRKRWEERMRTRFIEEGIPFEPNPRPVIVNWHAASNGIRGRFAHDIREVGVDNLDLVLGSMFGAKLGQVTVTTESLEDGIVIVPVPFQPC